MSKEFHKTHLTSCVGKQLFMKMTKGATIYVLVIVSYHVIADAHIHNQLAQINNIVGVITNLKMMHALEVIADETHDRELAYSLDVP